MSTDISLLTAQLNGGDEFVLDQVMETFMENTTLKRVKRDIVYNLTLDRYIEITKGLFLLPIYLPEICFLLSLDITSKNLAKSLYQQIINVKDEVVLSALYNYSDSENRVVSWGNVSSHRLPDDVLSRYQANVTYDLLITPSIVTSREIVLPNGTTIAPSKRNRLISPNRWFHTYYNNFQAVVSYNVNVVYLKRERLQQTLQQAKKRRIWVSFPLSIYEVEADAILFDADGRVKAKPVDLHFDSDCWDPACDISKILEQIEGEGDYFICSTISFINDKIAVNIVDTLKPLVFSEYEILPFLFPLKVDPASLNSLLYRFTVEKSVYSRILSRLQKFSKQSPQLAGAFNTIIKQNNTFEINENQEDFIVSLVNPAVVPFVVKKALKISNTNRPLAKTYFDLISGNTDQFISKIEQLEQKFRTGPSKDYLAIYGIDSLLSLRSTIMNKFIDLYKQNL